MINVKKGYSLETQNVIASKKTYTFLHYQTIILSILYNHYKKKKKKNHTFHSLFYSSSN